MAHPTIPIDEEVLAHLRKEFDRVPIPTQPSPPVTATFEVVEDLCLCPGPFDLTVLPAGIYKINCLLSGTSDLDLSLTPEAGCAFHYIRAVSGCRTIDWRHVRQHPVDAV